jgi:hypothetical protein
MWPYIQKLLVSLLGSPTILRAMLTKLSAWMTEAAKQTATPIDDIFAKVLTAIVTNDELWEIVVPLLPILLGVSVNDDVPVADNPEVGAAATRIAEATGLEQAAVVGALASMGS